MKNNNPFIWLIVLTIVMQSINCNSTKHSNRYSKQDSLVLSAILGGYEADTTVTIRIVITIYNPTSDTIEFASMKCSYWDFFTTDTTAFEVQTGNYPCFSNNLYFIKLPPGKRTDRYITLKPENWEHIKAIKKLRIGMYQLKLKENQGYGDLITLYNNRKQAPILWSNELDLERLINKIY